MMRSFILFCGFLAVFALLWNVFLVAWVISSGGVELRLSRALISTDSQYLPREATTNSLPATNLITPSTLLFRPLNTSSSSSTNSSSSSSSNSSPHSASITNAFLSKQVVVSPNSVHSTCQVGPYNGTKLQSFVKRMKTVVPPSDQFSSEYRTPCWNSYMNISSQVFETFRKASKRRLKQEEASYLMDAVFKTTSSKSFVCLPKVFFMGFPRSGSTQLYKMLMRHPQLRAGYTKEPHWWAKSTEQFSKSPHDMLSIVRYISVFQQAFNVIKQHPDTLLIDASQSTIWDTRVLQDLCFLPQLFSEILPGSKYIVLMRDPIERLYSDYKYLCEQAWKSEGLTKVPEKFKASGSEIFHDKVTSEVEEFRKCMESGSSVEQCTHMRLSGTGDSLCGHVRLGVSLYHVHIRRWMREIPREQFLFLTTDQLASRPLQLLKEVWHFLGVREQHEGEIGNVLHEHLHSSHSGQSSSGSMKSETMEMLREFFQPHNEALAELLGDDRYRWEKK